MILIRVLKQWKRGSNAAWAGASNVTIGAGIAKCNLNVLNCTCYMVIVVAGIVPAVGAFYFSDEIKQF